MEGHQMNSRITLRGLGILLLIVTGCAMSTSNESASVSKPLAVRPHFKYMGANFELSLVGRLDKE